MTGGRGQGLPILLELFPAGTQQSQPQEGGSMFGVLCPLTDAWQLPQGGRHGRCSHFQ